MDPIRADPGATFAANCNNGQVQGGLHPGLGDSERELLVRRACGEVRQSVSTMFRDMSSNFSANDWRSIEVLASGIPQHHGAWVAVISQRGAHLFVCGNAHASVAAVNGSIFSRARADEEREYAELLDSKTLQTGNRAPFAATKFRTSFVSWPLPAPEAPLVL